MSSYFIITTVQYHSDSFSFTCHLVSRGMRSESNSKEVLVRFRYKYKFQPLPDSKCSLPRDGAGRLPVGLTAYQVRTLIDAFKEHDCFIANRAADQLVKFFRL